MSDGELNRLELEVEDARARLAANLDRLRAPETFAEFKRTVVDEVNQSKEEWIEQGKAIASDRARHLLEDLKSRAAANPVAAAAIGAGLLWHLIRRPPITSLLVGAGVVSLFRTDPRQPSAIVPVVAQAQQVSDATSEKLSEWSAAASEAATQVGAAAGSVKETVSGWVDRSRETVGDIATQVSDRAAGNVAGNFARGTRTWSPNNDEQRDSLLFGMAATALVAALGIAYQRRASDQEALRTTSNFTH
jgi:hypothetical protein